MDDVNEYLTESELQRIGHIDADIADLQRMKSALVAEKAKIKSRGVGRAEAAARKRRRSAESTREYFW